MTSPFSGSGHATPADVPTLLGIWRVGHVLHSNATMQLTLAQSADAPESPRWDYVIKRGVNTNKQPQAKAAIAQTIAVAADVQHPNLIAVLDGASTGVFPYTVMPLLKGETMGMVMQRAEQTALPVALWLARQAADAIAALHSVGWMHGKLSPDNVMIGAGGHVTVLDYSCSQRIGSPLSRLSSVAGEYAPPEQANATAAASASMDVFALGRLLWQWMLKVQLREDSQLESVAALVEQMIDPVADARPTAGVVTDTLLRLELQSLSQHIGPATQQPIRRAA